MSDMLELLTPNRRFRCERALRAIRAKMGRWGTFFSVSHISLLYPTFVFQDTAPDRRADGFSLQ